MTTVRRAQQAEEALERARRAHKAKVASRDRVRATRYACARGYADPASS